jgi:hypothetical protein
LLETRLRVDFYFRSFPYASMACTRTISFFCGSSTLFRVMASTYGASRSLSADTPHSVGLLWMSDRPVTETTTWQQTTLTTDFYDPGGVQTRNPNKRAAAVGPRFRPSGHRTRPRGQINSTYYLESPPNTGLTILWTDSLVNTWQWPCAYSGHKTRPAGLQAYSCLCQNGTRTGRPDPRSLHSEMRLF